MEYKFVELLSCQFQACSEELVRQQITYRYNVVKVCDFHVSFRWGSRTVKGRIVDAVDVQ